MEDRKETPTEYRRYYGFTFHCLSTSLMSLVSLCSTSPLQSFVVWGVAFPVPNSLGCRRGETTYAIGWLKWGPN
jgi:hypothetical protein